MTEESIKEQKPRYLATFDSAGNRTSTYICNNEKEVEEKEAAGCVEITEEDWNIYIGNKGGGIRYVRGTDGSPTPYVDTLDETKTKALNIQYKKYQKDKYAIAWLTDGSGYGFDTDKDSQTDWLSVINVLKNSNSNQGYYKVYTDPNDTSKKQFLSVSLSQLEEAGNVSRAQQTKAYSDFETVKAIINNATTKEELQKYLS